MINGKVLEEIYLWILVVVFMGVLCAQFYVSHSFVGSIETTNYFALLFSAMGFSVCALPLVFSGKTKIGWGDVAVVGFLLYIVINSYFNNSIETTEFRMTIAYFSLYFALRLVNDRYPEFTDYATIAIMVVGIYQSALVLRQLYGFDYSNHGRFAVTGSFYNPGPCGIFLSAVLVLAVAVMKNCEVKRSVKYILAYVTIIATLLAIFPTMSRAGWIGAAVCIAVIYRAEILQLMKSKIVLFLAVIVAVGVVVGVYVMKKESANGRLFMWRNSVSALCKAPLTGVGIGNFAESYSEAQYCYFVEKEALNNYDKNIDVVGVPTSAFNEVIAVTMLLGVVGLAFCLFILCRKASNAPLYYMAVAIVISSLFSYTFYIPAIGIIFILALACSRIDRRFAVPSYIFTVALLLPFINYGVVEEMKAHKEWKNSSMLYSMKIYEDVCEDYPALLPILSKNHKFMFEYGHSLNKTERYRESNEILLQGGKYSTDPMFWTIIGNNYMSLGKYEESAESYLRAYYQCPNRLYPIFLLTKMYDKIGGREKMLYYGNILLNKTPKIKSSAVDEMKEETNIILNK